jgi:Major Facilitator Superfamily
MESNTIQKVETTEKDKQESRLITAAAALNFTNILILLQLVLLSNTTIGLLESDALLGFQMVGMLFGGLFFGMAADSLSKNNSFFRRYEALNISVFGYSLCSVLGGVLLIMSKIWDNNQNVNLSITILSYLLRFFTGCFLAGQYGTFVTVITEFLPEKKRNIASSKLTFWGFMAAIANYIIIKGVSFCLSSEKVNSFLQKNSLNKDFLTEPLLLTAPSLLIIGGLLTLYIFSYINRKKYFDLIKQNNDESFIFLREKHFSFEKLKELLNDKERKNDFLRLLFVNITTWFCIGILAKHSTDIYRSIMKSKIFEESKETYIIDYKMDVINCLKDTDVVTEFTITSTFFAYLGLIVGTIVIFKLSDKLKSRKKAVSFFLVLNLLTMLWFLMPPIFNKDYSSFEIFRIYVYVKVIFLGFSLGYWGLVTVSGGEMFKKRVRGTVTNILPNFARAMLALFLITYHLINNQKSDDNLPLPNINWLFVIIILLSYISITCWNKLPETYGKRLE